MDRYMVIAGRVLLSVIFVISGYRKITGFHGTEGSMTSKGIPTAVPPQNFWAFSGPERQTQQIQFLKNVAIMGGLLAFAGRERA